MRLTELSVTLVISMLYYRSVVARTSWLKGQNEVQNLIVRSVQYWLDVECWTK